MSKEFNDYDVEVVETEVIMQRFRDREDGTPGGVSYYQNAYLNKGKKNDVEFRIPCTAEQFKNQDGYSAGFYVWTSRNILFDISKYGVPEYSKEIQYGNRLFPIKPVLVDASAQKKAA